MKKDKIKEKYIKLLFNEIENEKLEEYFENYEYNFASINYDIYVFNKKIYKLKSFNENLKKELLLYLFRFNFYVPRIIRRIIFKRLLIYDESKDTSNFNYKVYLLLSFLKNPNINETTQKTVDLDVFRTRIDKQNEKTIYFFNIFLNYVCSHFQFKYKQGLNEVLALFFYLKGKFFNIIDVYFCFQNFVQRFLKEFYYDDEFFFLQISFYLFKILIKYHDPVLSEILENNKMNPEIYAASWFLTLFASKSNLEILNSIYLIFLLERNPFFFFFFSLALLILHRNVFICVDSSNLPELLSKINIFDKIFLKKVWSLGKYLEKNTPVSFTHKLFFIKNILIYLTNENSAENDHKKNLLLTFFKSIDYMSTNSYEIIKNISSGINDYIFLDIRPNKHFKNFHFKNSINIDFENNYENILRRSMKIKKKQKKENKVQKNNLYIWYILKKYDNHEIGHNYLLLFSFLLCSKYNKKINISYDDNIILKTINNQVPSESNDLIFDTLKWQNKTRRNKKQRNNNMSKRTKEIKLEGINKRDNVNNGYNNNKKKKYTETGNILHLEENKVVDLNLFFFNLYKNKKSHSRQNKMINIDNNSRKKRINKNSSVKNILEPLKYINIINYIREKKVKDLKKYYSDDDTVVEKFSLTCYHVKKWLNEKIEKENKKKGRKISVPIKRDGNAHNDSLINIFSIDKNNKDSEICKQKKCFTNKDEENNINDKKNDDTNYRSNSCFSNFTSSGSNNEQKKSNEMVDPKLNISSYSLYVLIKEKVLKYEELLKVPFENILSSDKEILILYDDDLNNSKYVRTFYYYLLYTYKIRKVSIIEGGINSYHTLIKNDSFFKQIENNTINGRVVGDTIENNNYEDHLNFYLHYYNFFKDENVLQYCFHQSNVCYLCKAPNIPKKFLDDFFSEIYNDYPIFEEVYYFLTCENICINLLSFYDLIIRKKKIEKIKCDKKNNSDGALSHFSKIFNYIKKKKESSSLSMPSSTWITDGVSYNDKYNVGAEKDSKSFFSNKKNSFLTNKNYFSLNYYLDYYYKKGKTNFPFDPENRYDEYETEINKNEDMRNTGMCYNLCGKMNEKDLCDHEENKKKSDDKINPVDIYAHRNGKNDEMDNKYMDRNKILNKNGNEQIDEEMRKCFSLEENSVNEKIRNFSMFTNSIDKKNITNFDTYNIYSYIDVVCYSSLLEKCSGDNDKDEKIYCEENLKKKNACKIFNCFINHVYQPIIPHNIRSNNIINNFVEYVKYYKSSISNINNNIATDPNLYLNCNKLDSKLFLNIPYLPYTYFRQPKYSYYKDNKKQSIEKDGTSFKRNRNSININYDSKKTLEKSEGADINHSDLQDSKAYNDLLNNSILNNTWIKNKPDLSLCKLMIYDNLLILYGSPYICDTDIIVRNLNEVSVTEFGMNDNNKKDLCSKEDNKNNLIKNIVSSQIKKRNESDKINEKKENIFNNLDIGSKNFLKENEKYRNKKGDKNIHLNSCDDKLEKIIIHKYKDLKKKDVLFNIDCYKLNSIDINWANMSNHIFHSITNEHIYDIYNYYQSYFNLSKSNMSSKEIIYSSSSLSSSNLVSHIPDEQDYSFSDYHNLYTKNLKEKNNLNKTEIFHYKNVKIDAVNIYAIFDIRSIYKITTKRTLGKTLYFYFKINESTPLMGLNFENDAEMQSCVCSVKEVHTMLSKEKK
ncbi:conserved Plasmodium protein, unknown function [Plasmodium berghei]|uniref:TBC1 domain family member 23 n=2 Tax=Plasmodium berghei TaxID=5821 RepID=A0A509AV75_PLABA|nr:TBC domain-containing protein, putative [Plasmodium berghei ANKA]CXJ24010.1 conserved Plasmodium protein, unknown function [Plasmodium berghei]SCM26767.1 conserved Plasmodium protein, unknown function [Plasmodium berghei]SCN28627.1 conserved Plasmodium protein, unknown function [Plasmodium berghei]SCO62827.1 conserved Plasmodium protein, unknown function [Plasmodium berghei]SCO64375.1 conserved Plasmodium protein, unknown function [Plasmodium berghei]|eukprot:XP_034424271.1 TBC domain-containing protein, putative [Plasmodium berghei ANKA]